MTNHFVVFFDYFFFECVVSNRANDYQSQHCVENDFNKKYVQNYS